MGPSIPNTIPLRADDEKCEHTKVCSLRFVRQPPRGEHEVIEQVREHQDREVQRWQLRVTMGSADTDMDTNDACSGAHRSHGP